MFLDEGHWSSVAKPCCLSILYWYLEVHVVFVSIFFSYYFLKKILINLHTI
jgi:hypothetical protein